MSVPTINSGVTGWNPSVVGGLGATYKVFPAPNYPNPGVGGPGNSGYNGSILNGNVIAATPTTTPLTLGVPANGQYEGQRFNVTASGNLFVHGTSPTLLFAMYNGTSMTVGSDGTPLVVLASALTGLTTGATYPWSWSTVFQGDSKSGILQAISSSLWIDNATAGTVTLTGATGINFLSAGPTGLIGPGYTSGSSNALNLIIAMEFTVTDALNVGRCMQFVLES